MKGIKLFTIALIISTFALQGCSLTPKKGNKPVVVQPVERIDIELPSIKPFEAKDVEWTIITVDNYEEVFYKLEKNNIDGAIFGLTDKGYENLSMNIAALRKLIQQQNAIIFAYEKYYKQNNDEK
jgi:hypothetical protein